MNYRRQIEALLGVVDVVQDDTFRWFGEAVQVPPQASLNEALAEHLYQNFYAVGAPVRFPRSNTPSTDCVSGLPLQRQLAAADGGSGHRQSDWRVAAIDGGQLRLTRRALSVRIPATECRPAEGKGFVVGDRAVVDAPSARPWRSPGYYLVIGDNVAGRDDAAPIVRIYWNITDRGRVSLMRSLTHALNALQLVFWFKVATGAPSARCDQAVLYLYRRDLAAARSVLQAVCRELRNELRSAVPALTLRLAPGVAAAEDPGNGESFGSDRCALLAQYIAARDPAGANGVDDIAAHFRGHGIDLERPYQALTSPPLDGLTFDPPRVVVSERKPAHGEPQLREQALDCARAIGAELQHSAVWHADRCSWFGHQLSAGCCGGTRDSVPVAPLGADLYSGVGGVGWFLAELARVIDEPALTATANAALRQAVYLLETQRPDLGLYSGHLGTAIALLQAAGLLGEAALKRAAGLWLTRSLAQADNATGFDLISGLAGRALGLVRFGQLCGDDRPIDAGRQCADELIASAQRSRDGLCWADDAQQPALLGYAHGTAGAAHALLEVFAATGEPRYRDAAESAIAYEQSRFDRQAQDWPDLRRRGALADVRTPARPQFSATWCHGSPGIAVTRLRAFELLGDTQYHAQADVALRAVEKGLRASLESGVDDASLCHGMTGSMAVLIEGGHGMDTCRSAAGHGTTEFLHATRWPSGLIQGTTPSLMLGLAGIGHTYLRLHTPVTTPVPGFGSGERRRPDRPQHPAEGVSPTAAC